MIAVTIVSGIVTFTLYKKGHFRYVNRDDLIEAGPEGNELWGWVDEDKRGPYTGWVREWSSDAQSQDKEGNYLKAKYFVKDGKKDGKYEKWSADGKKLKEGHFDDGEREGNWSFWYESGQKKMEIHFGRKILIETAIVWKPNGVPCPTTRVVNGNGTIAVYHDNSEKMEEATLLGGMRTGPSVSWHENGQKSGEGVFKDGKKDGEWTSYYSNGVKNWEGFFHAGKIEGKSTFWHENGEKWEEGIFRDGRREGEWQRWNKDGTSNGNDIYKDGNEIGE